ncbi:NAD-dependent epimerase/dehydratase family protein [Thermogladius sp.]|uniref:NAD-dependent epimerase/dehydratase family protein n=1 Tax=Thermogladius sp. TaxID=2023064 RepID=UPI003D0C2577
MRILVTGGAGFIGSHLVRALVSSSFQVRIFDNLSRGSLDNIRDVLASIEFVEGDVRDYGAVEDVVRGVDAVVHLAALTDVAESTVEPNLYFDVNVRGTYNVAKASRSVSVLVFASSSAVYGEPVKLPIPEDHPLQPKSPYAATKVAGEALVLSFSELYGYRPVVLRLFNVYGPRQSKSYTGVITEFIKRVSRGEPPVIYGDGRQTRDFVHVADVVEAVVTSIKSSRARGVYNIGSGRAVSVNELAKTIMELMGRLDLKPIYKPPRPGDVRHSVANISRAFTELRFNPRIHLLEGLRGLILGGVASGMM